MVGRIFAVLSLLAVLYGAACGRLSLLGDAMLAGAGRAAPVLVSLIGMTTLFGALFGALRAAGLLARLEGLLGRWLSFLFPNAVREGLPLGAAVSAMLANFLGMGNAATPLALTAATELGRGCSDGSASDDLILFVSLACFPLTLFPSSVVAMRAAAGSASSAAILPAVWIVSAAVFVLAVLLCRLAAKVTGRRR